MVFEHTGDIGFHFSSTPDAANLRAGDPEGDDPNWRDPMYPYSRQHARVYPVRLLIRNPLRLPDLYQWESKNIKGALLDAGYTREELDRLFPMDTMVDQESLYAALQAHGYDSIVYKNEVEYTGDEENAADSYIVFRPEQIKSVFNPAPNPESPDITAAKRVDWAEVEAVAHQIRAERTDDLQTPSTGQCYRLSLMLGHALLGLGYEPLLAVGYFILDRPMALDSDDQRWEHFWLELDGRVVDISADQFNQYVDDPMPEVFIGERPDRYDDASTRPITGREPIR